MPPFDWKESMRTIALYVLLCSMSASTGAAIVWHSFAESRLARVGPRAVPTHAMITPQIRAASVDTSLPVIVGVQGNQITQLQEQTAQLQKIASDLAQRLGANQENNNHRLDVIETRSSTFGVIFGALGSVLIAIGGWIITMLKAERHDQRRRYIPS